GRRGPRRLRVRHRVPGGALLPRRQDHPDLRGHVADPEARHRPPPARDGGRGMSGGHGMGEGRERTRADWQAETYRPFVEDAPERPGRVEALSGISLEPLYTPRDLPRGGDAGQLGDPGEVPDTPG